MNKTISSTTEERPEFESKLLDLARVTRVTAGGKRFSFRAVVVVGNRNGKVGVGVDKGSDVALAIEKAVRQAKKNIINVPIKDGTIPYAVDAKYCSARILLKPGLKGKGIVAGGVVRVICELAGIENVSAKVIGRTKNKLNNARATIKALKQLEI
ncbi:30S ribosomal protein S5 [bacterium]|nr:30S ribosomal protein S5 [bacterium]